MRRELALLALLALAACGSAPQRDTRPSTDSRRSAAELNVGLGQGYLEQGQLQVALEKLQKALELDPRFDSAHTVIAVVYEKIGDIERARTHYSRAVELSPKKGAVLNNYGTFLCRHGQYAEADALFARALADPFYDTPAAALANRGSCAMSWGKRDLAEQSLRRAVQLAPNQADALFQLAQLTAENGDFFRARAFLQRHEGLAPASAEALQLAMQIEAELGNRAGVREYRKRLLEEFPDSELAARARSEEKPQ
jgi:type IV pilus assembly protein PilF